ncbi:uncharacterized protein BDR25DRAFT_357374 [Lindgomyces ingoldianus]|uniref:Uncharacterized protein n=1 Tax=Lindgomyces ingoldianus TaxID=673940 RepID=A0ACB6QN96_9PLEO|nr:uncharacterized protein BDR25DRAFT_357374 [Lindgomyces ingoldianus]KAF2468444.1 hypothetical protein BDR25DRAFT_357374 [Lindgomyces ingoldianus]
MNDALYVMRAARQGNLVMASCQWGRALQSFLEMEVCEQFSREDGREVRGREYPRRSSGLECGKLKGNVELPTCLGVLGSGVMSAQDLISKPPRSSTFTSLVGALQSIMVELGPIAFSGPSPSKIGNVRTGSPSIRDSHINSTLAWWLERGFLQEAKQDLAGLTNMNTPPDHREPRGANMDRTSSSERLGTSDVNHRFPDAILGSGVSTVAKAALLIVGAPCAPAPTSPVTELAIRDDNVPSLARLLASPLCITTSGGCHSHFISAQETLT